MATNPRAMFDGRVGTLTTGNQPWIVGTGNGLQIEVAPGRVINNIVLFGLVGVSVTAEVEGQPDIPLALRHSALPLHAVQFHPESVLTPLGRDVLAGWLATLRK